MNFGVRYCFLPREQRIYIFSPSCDILYILGSNHVLLLSRNKQQLDHSDSQSITRKLTAYTALATYEFVFVAAVKLLQIKIKLEILIYQGRKMRKRSNALRKKWSMASNVKKTEKEKNKLFKTVIRVFLGRWEEKAGIWTFCLPYLLLHVKTSDVWMNTRSFYKN